MNDLAKQLMIDEKINIYLCPMGERRKLLDYKYLKLIKSLTQINN